jgi:nucleoside-diphosphate-sugar epimerase
MRIFVAGATGAVGKQLVPLLVAAGHTVVGTSRDARRAAGLRDQGASGVALDPLDERVVRRALRDAAPDVVVHQLTALSDLGPTAFRNMDKAFAATNRLRTDGVDLLLDAAREVGAKRFVAQSFSGWPSARTGGPVSTEDEPLDPSPPKRVRETLAAIRHLESVVPAADGIAGLALRYGGFYGPGTGTSPGGSQYEAVRKRQFPIIGDGGGVWSLVHIEDVAGATAAAVERGEAGIYNVVDDDPAPIREWLPAFAAAIGAPPPRRVPVWLGRLLAGEQAVVMMTSGRGASNAKAKRELGWQPRFASWREGFRTGLG